MFNSKPFHLAILLFLPAAQILFSQITVQGIVQDNGGEFLGNGAEPVVNALVTLTDQSDATRFFTAYTNGYGQYLIQIPATKVNHPSTAPELPRLHQNYPNPFNPSTIIGYELSEPGHVTIDIHDILGRKIITLLDGFQTGSGQVVWHATDAGQHGVPAGIYIYSIQAGDVRINRKMMLMDGHHSSACAPANVQRVPEIGRHPDLGKPLSDIYTIQVSGTDIETCQQDNIEITGDLNLDLTARRTVTDIDHNVYRTVKIGDQWWMAENLKVLHYRNGDAVRNVTWDAEWSGLTTDAYCDFDNNPAWSDIYGRLYNWYALTDPRILVPAGWHVPSDAEWQTLEMTLGMTAEQANGVEWRGTDEGGKLKDPDMAHWKNPNTGATNSSGFTALGAGVRSDNGTFYDFHYYAMFWTSTIAIDQRPWYRWLDNDYAQIYRYYGGFKIGISVRCIRD